MTEYSLESGSEWPAPTYDRWHPPTGEITWFDTNTTAVSTSGPCLSLSFDLSLPHLARRTLVAVVRVVSSEQYLSTSRSDYQDPDGLLAVTAAMNLNPEGLAENIVLVLPFATLPEDTGGTLHLELAVFDQETGELVALRWFEAHLPEDLQRNPDLLTLLVHTLVAVVKSSGPLEREEVRVIRSTMVNSFELDALGDHTLRRILKTANKTPHSVTELARILKLQLPQDDHERFVDLLYDAAEADGGIDDAEQAFIDDLCHRLGVHDHVRFGAERLAPFYRELELEPGADLTEVKKAYRRLVRDYHPDRVQHLAQGFLDFAHEKVKKLNAAWTELEKHLE